MSSAGALMPPPSTQHVRLAIGDDNPLTWRAQPCGSCGSDRRLYETLFTTAVGSPNSNMEDTDDKPLSYLSSAPIHLLNTSVFRGGGVMGLEAAGAPQRHPPHRLCVPQAPGL
nr:unnamed protein product [Leishmania braziliensis]CAJ2467014.1 unnamed protein product [Leishmania braziliensis]